MQVDKKASRVGHICSEYSLSQSRLGIHWEFFSSSFESLNSFNVSNIDVGSCTLPPRTPPWLYVETIHVGQRRMCRPVGIVWVCLATVACYQWNLDATPVACSLASVGAKASQLPGMAVDMCESYRTSRVPDSPDACSLVSSRPSKKHAEPAV